jgi:hypothetical protein
VGKERNGGIPKRFEIGNGEKIRGRRGLEAGKCEAEEDLKAKGAEFSV